MLKCYYSSNFPAVKMEDLSIDPRIIIARDVIGDRKIQKIIPALIQPADQDVRRRCQYELLRGCTFCFLLYINSIYILFCYL